MFYFYDIWFIFGDEGIGNSTKPSSFRKGIEPWLYRSNIDLKNYTFGVSSPESLFILSGFVPKTEAKTWIDFY